MTNIQSAREAAQMQIELMKWDSRYIGTKLAGMSEDEREEAADLVERKLEYVANAWGYLQEQIENATSKKEIIMAWVAGECVKREDALRIYDLGMSSRIALSSLRKHIKTANDVAMGKPAKESQRISANAILDWIEKELITHLGEGAFWNIMHDVHVEKTSLRDGVAAEMKRRGGKK